MANLIEFCEIFFVFSPRSVGRTFQAVDKHLGTKFYNVTQRERPRKCELCHISDGIHAMHPLYDFHGRGGRHICRYTGVKDDEGNKIMRLAWGHSLCCLVLGINGLLYGCGNDGSYHGDDDVVVDNRPPNPTPILAPEFEKAYGDYNAAVFFRYYLPLPKKADLDVYRKERQELQRVRCQVCGLKDDKNENIMRIPLQCFAGNADEREEFKGKHPSLRSDDVECCAGLHIGCARWGPNPNRARRVYYYP
jgi:hypothetical protein